MPEQKLISRPIAFTEKTWEALRELAAITEISGGENQVNILIQDALRLYEWAINQQALNWRITCIKDDDMLVLANAHVDGTRSVLTGLFPEKNKEKVLEYFAKSA